MWRAKAARDRACRLRGAGNLIVKWGRAALMKAALMRGIRHKRALALATEVGAWCDSVTQHTLLVVARYQQARKLRVLRAVVIIERAIAAYIKARRAQAVVARRILMYYRRRKKMKIERRKKLIEVR
ncbi:unnamed protein product [Chrysoparadoxa australica]